MKGCKKDAFDGREKKKINLRLFEVFRYIERSFRVLLINFGMNSSDKYLDNTAIKPRDND